MPDSAMRFRVGRHSPINIWLERDNEPDIQWAMACNDHMAATMVRLLNAGVAAETDGEPAVEPERCICSHTTDQHVSTGRRECAYRDACGCQYYQQREATVAPDGGA